MPPPSPLTLHPPRYVLKVLDWYLPTAIKYISKGNTNHDFNLTYLNDAEVIANDDYFDAIQFWKANDGVGTALMETPWTNKAWLDETEDGKNDNRRQTEGQAAFYLYNLWDTDDYITMIGEMEKVFESTGSKLNIDDPSYDRLSLFGDGAVFTFFEQYMTLDKYGFQVAAYALLGVWAVGCVFSGVYCGTVMMFMIATMIFELLGFLGLAGVKMSALPMVTVLSCIGISMEFVGHIAASFSSEEGGSSGNDRIAHVYSNVYLPIVDGSVSTMLAILMLSQSDFQFVVLYFFLPYAAMVGIGLVNGIFILPVLLSFGWDLLGLGKGRKVEVEEEEGEGVD